VTDTSIWLLVSTIFDVLQRWKIASDNEASFCSSDLHTRTCAHTHTGPAPFVQCWTLAKAMRGDVRIDDQAVGRLLRRKNSILAKAMRGVVRIDDQAVGRLLRRKKSILIQSAG
jgi:glutamate 5-kinase